MPVVGEGDERQPGDRAHPLGGHEQDAVAILGGENSHMHSLHTIRVDEGIIRLP